MTLVGEGPGVDQRHIDSVRTPSEPAVDLAELQRHPHFDRSADLLIGAREEFEFELLLEEICVASQMRGKFNPEHIDNLSQSIEVKDLQHSPIVYFLTPAQAQEYLQQTNSVFGASITIDSFTQVAGGYFVLAAGECRLRAAKQYANRYAEKNGIDNLRAEIKCVVRSLDSVADIISDQSAENVHESPSPESFAYSLYWQYKVGLASGKYTCEADLIADSPSLNPRRAKEALRYVELPEEVRVWTESGFMPYGFAVQLTRYVEPYKQYLATKGVSRERWDDFIAEELYNKARKLKSLAGSIPEAGKIVTGWGNDLLGLQEHFGDLFLTPEDADLHEKLRQERENKAFMSHSTNALARVTEAIAIGGEIDGIDPRSRVLWQKLLEHAEVIVKKHSGEDAGRLALEASAKIQALLANVPDAPIQEDFGF